MAYCYETTNEGGKEVECVKADGHDGCHAGHVPQEDQPGLMWPKHEWE